jgi:uncharacterized protein (TIGR03083 family)
MAHIDYVAHLERDSRALVDLVASDQRVSVPACPDWTMRDLAAHVGWVWAMATGLIDTRATAFAPPGAEADVPDDDDRVVSWLEERRTALLTAVRAIAPDEPVWGWWGGTDGGFYHRRMALETMIHRWDAADALGRSVRLDRELAVDGIDELLDVGLRHYLDTGQRSAPGGSLHLHCTDGEGEWLAEVIDDQLVVRHEHAKGDAAVRGPAASLLLYLWGRPAPEVEVLGDAATAAAWVALAP